MTEHRNDNSLLPYRRSKVLSRYRDLSSVNGTLRRRNETFRRGSQEKFRKLALVSAWSLLEACDGYLNSRWGCLSFGKVAVKDCVAWYVSLATLEADCYIGPLLAGSIHDQSHSADIPSHYTSRYRYLADWSRSYVNDTEVRKSSAGPPENNWPDRKFVTRQRNSFQILYDVSSDDYPSALQVRRCVTACH